MLTLAEATEVYQTMLEGHRAHPEDEQLYEDLVRAREQMEWAWGSTYLLDLPPTEEEHMDHAILIGRERDEEDSQEDHLSMGVLSAEVRHRWVCRDCLTLHLHDVQSSTSAMCVVWVACYQRGQGSQYALCQDHVLQRMASHEA